MRVAVLVTGQVKSGNPLGDLKKNNKRMKEKFSGADFYYGTWKQFEKDFKENFPDDNCFYFDEPKVHYHPYIDVPNDAHISHHFTDRVAWAKTLNNEKRQWTSHHTKQMLVHCMLLDEIEKLGKTYDVIVRTRFDAFIHKKADFTKFLQETYDTGLVHGFAVTRQNMFNQYYESPMEKGSKHTVYMLDQMIIHKASNIDTSSVYKLFEDKKLHAAEFGWYQILSMPYNGHKNNHGFVNHDKNVLDKFLMELA